MEIFRKHDVYVVSDEIWSDIILDDHKHIPTQSVSADAREREVAAMALRYGLSVLSGEELPEL